MELPYNNVVLTGGLKMFGRDYLYDFGVSQDDPQSELKALNIRSGDRVLCIASAGEVPLEMLINSHESVTIDAVEISNPQLYLTNLKLKAATALAGRDAARFLGYLPAKKSDRIQWYRKIVPDLTKDETFFWDNNASSLSLGAVNLGKYETYMARFAPLGRLLLGGRKKVLGLFETDNISEQKLYFDDVLRAEFLKNLFKIMFHPRFYKSRGISEEGLMHWQDRNLGDKFYRQFRNFCTNTPVRKNWLLQFSLFNRVLFEEALPGFLQEKGQRRLQSDHSRLRLLKISITEKMRDTENGTYNKFALSNVSDWLSEADFTELLKLIAEKSGPGGSGLIRYIHSATISDPELEKKLGFNYEEGEELLKTDRFPFYKLIPFSF